MVFTIPQWKIVKGNHQGTKIYWSLTLTDLGVVECEKSHLYNALREKIDFGMDR